jgi:hypothetical protein
MCLLISSTKFCVKHFSFQEELNEIWSKMYIGLHVKYQFLLEDFNDTWTSRQFFEKYSNISSQENPSSGNRVVPCGQTDERTGITKLIVAFRNFANAPKTNDSTWMGNIRDITRNNNNKKLSVIRTVLIFVVVNSALGISAFYLCFKFYRQSSIPPHTSGDSSNLVKINR